MFAVCVVGVVVGVFCGVGAVSRGTGRGLFRRELDPDWRLALIL